MRVAVSIVLALAVSLMGVGKASAAKPGKHHEHPALVSFDVVKQLNLTEEQKAKVKDLKKEYGPKLKEAGQKAASILTAEQKKARDEAIKAAKAANKKVNPKELNEVMKLTDEQKTKMDAARKEAQALAKEVNDKIMEILTPEQKEQLKTLKQKKAK
jgi:Spy/CpxP family protein refolding chaperone